MSTKKVLLICQTCSEHNGGEWRTPTAAADLLFGKCHVCEELKPITHIHYYKNISSSFDFKVPPKTKEFALKEIIESKEFALREIIESTEFGIKAIAARTEFGIKEIAKSESEPKGELNEKQVAPAKEPVAPAKPSTPAKEPVASAKTTKATKPSL